MSFTVVTSMAIFLLGCVRISLRRCVSYREYRPARNSATHGRSENLPHGSMSPSPETRQSLLVRLVDRADEEAWHEFARIYGPVVYRLAVRKGLQHADAEDLAQQVLTAVSRAIDRWQTDPTRARFRTWLHRIAHNLIVNALTRAAPDRAAGDTGTLDQLHKAAADGPDSDLVRFEF